MCDHNEDEPSRAAIEATMREMNKPIITEDDPLPGMSSVRVRMQVCRSEPSETPEGFQPFRPSITKRMFPNQKRILDIDKDPELPTIKEIISNALNHDGVLLGVNQVRRSLRPLELRNVISTRFVDIEHYTEMFRKLIENNDKEILKKGCFIFDSYVDFSDVRPVGERLCVDESHRLNDRSELTDEEKAYLIEDLNEVPNEDLTDYLRTSPFFNNGVTSREIAPGIYYVNVEMSEQDIRDRIMSAHPHEAGDADDRVNIGNGQTITRKELRETLGKINNQLTPAKPFMSAFQAIGRIKRVDDMSDDELIKELDPLAPAGQEDPTFLQPPTTDELDAIEYPMPGHLWTLTKSHPQVNAAVLKATARCLWVKVELTPDCPEVHVMNREQFRSFLTHHGEHEDWKTRRPNWRNPQTSDDVLRYNLTITTYTGVDELLQHMIEHQFPYIEHTPV